MISRASGTLTYTDTLQLTRQPARLRYAVRYLNAASQRASSSKFVLIEPAVSIAQPPVGVSVRESETALNVLAASFGQHRRLDAARPAWL